MNSEIRNQLYLLGKSISIMSFISLSLSLTVNLLFDKDILATFILGCILQILIYSFINDFLIKARALKVQELELNKLEQLSTILSCASCKTNNLVTFIPEDNSRFEFVCENCKGKNVVHINFSVARTTESLDNQGQYE